MAIENDKVKDLYNFLRDEGYDFMGSESDFREKVSDSNSVNSLHDFLRDEGYDFMGTREDFYGKLNPANTPVSAPDQRPKAATQHPARPEQVYSQAGGQNGQTYTPGRSASQTPALQRPQKAAKRKPAVTAPASVPTSTRGMVETALGKPADTGFTYKGVTYEDTSKFVQGIPQQKDIVELAESIVEDSKQQADAKKAKKERQDATRSQVDELSNSIDEQMQDWERRAKTAWEGKMKSDANISPRSATSLVRDVASYMATKNRSNGPVDVNYNTPEIKALTFAKRSLDNAKNMIAEADHNAAGGFEGSFVAGVGRGFGQKFTDLSTWDFGASDLVDATTFLRILEKADKGEALSKSEQALLDAKVIEIATSEYFGDEVGRGYKAGSVTAESIPFMIEMMVNPIAGAGQGAEKMLARYALKRFARKGIAEGATKTAALRAAKKSMEKGGEHYVAGAVSRGVGRAVGDAVVGAPGMAATTGSMRTAANAIERMTGDVHFKVDDKGRSVYDYRDNQEKWFDAWRKAFLSTTIENYSEMFGNYFSPLMNAVGKGAAGIATSKFGKALRLDKVKDMVNNVSTNDWGRLVSDFEKRANWHGSIGEFAEEIVGGVLNAIIVGDQTLDTDKQTGVFNLDNLIDTFLGVSIMGGAFSAVNTGGYALGRHRLNRADAAGRDTFGEEWDMYQSSLSSEDDAIVKQTLKSIAEDKNLSEDQKKAAFRYANAAYGFRTVLSQEEKRREDPETDPAEQAVRDSFANGYDAGAEEQRDIMTEAEMGEPTEEQQAAVEGVRQRIEDDADTYIEETRNSVRPTLRADGSQLLATLREKDANGNDKEVYILDGDVVMTADGMVDREKTLEANGVSTIVIYDPSTGEKRQIDPTDNMGVQSVNPILTAEELEAQLQEQRQRYVQQRLDEAHGTVNVEPGQQIAMPDGQQATVVAADGENITIQTADGQQQTLPQAEVQLIADELKMADYLERHPESAAPEDAAAGQPTDNIVEGAPAEFLPDMRLMVRDDDGETKEAVVQGRVRYEGGQFVPDENGQIVEYMMDGEVHHDQIPTLSNKTDGYIEAPVAVPEETEQAEGAEAVPQPTESQEQAEVQQEESTVPAGESAETATAPAAAVEPMPMRTVRRKIDGKWQDVEEEDWMSTTPARAYQYLYEEAVGLGLPIETVDNLVKSNLDNAQRGVERAKKATGSIVSVLQKQREAQAVVDYWQQVQSLRNQQLLAEAEARDAATREERERRRAEAEAARKRDQEAYEAEVARRKAEQEKEKREQESKLEAMAKIGEESRAMGIDWPIEKDAEAMEVMNDIVPHTLEEVAAWMLGDTRGGYKIDPDAIRAHTGYGTADMKKFPFVFAKGGMSPEAFGEKIEQIARENDVNFDESDTNAGFNALLNVLGEAGSLGDLKNYIKNNRRAQAEEIHSANLRREAQAQAEDRWIAQHGGMTREEYDSYINWMEDAVEMGKMAITDVEYNQLFNTDYDRGTETNDEGSDQRGAEEGSADESEAGQAAAAADDTRGDGEEAEPAASPVAEAIAQQEVEENPTEGQKEAGNYKKAHVKVDGLDITIENKKGSTRSGVDPNGRAWSQTMNNNYGYILGTEGVDGDHIDMFLSDTPEQGEVFVVDQVNADGTFDEHKVMYGFPDIESARKAYLSNYEEGWQGLGAITPVSKEEFKKWVESSHRKTKPFSEYRSVETQGDVQVENGVNGQYSAEQREIGQAMVDQLENMGMEVSTDISENRRVHRQAEQDNSEAGKLRHFRTSDGKVYGFSYRGKIYLDPRRIDAEVPIHEYAHPWCEAFRMLNPDGWKDVVNMMQGDRETWELVKALNPDLTDPNDIVEEMIARGSGKNGKARAEAEYRRMGNGSNFGNVWNNIAKAIQDFWKKIGDFLNIKYETPEQIYDQVVKDFANKVNPRKRIEDYLKERDAEYLQAVESGDEAKARELFDAALRENIGNGMTPYVAAGKYRGGMDRLARGVKSRDPKVIAEVADLMAPLIPENAVLVPAPSHSGTATDMLDVANAIAERTGAPVADVLRSEQRASQYEAKRQGQPISSSNMGIRMDGQLPEGRIPIVIDNVVDTGNTAEACIKALGKGVVVSLADAADRRKHVASLKSANVVARDKNGNVVPLSQRFTLGGSNYLAKQKGEQGNRVSEMQKALVNGLVRLIRSAKVDITTAKREGQRMLDKYRAMAQLMNVWHGSGADFDKFDINKIGSGQGAQTFGYGHYVTQVKDIGKKYAQEIGDQTRPATFKGLNAQALVYKNQDFFNSVGATDADKVSALLSIVRSLNYGFGDPMRMIQVKRESLQSQIRSDSYVIKRKTQDLNNETDETKRKRLEDSIKYYEDKIEKANDIIKFVDSLDPKDFEGWKRNKGHYLYDVEIPDDNGSNYLEWDKPIREDQLTDIDNNLALQGIRRQEVSSTLNGEQKTFIRFTNDNAIVELYDGMTGEELYRFISRLFAGNDKSASEFLHNAGFTGIKYPAEYLSGGRTDGAMNYVIFDENDLKIIDKIRFHKADNGDYVPDMKPTFYSNAMKAVEGIKQEKATAEQWMAMLQKNGGLKAGEDKWIGLSDWLNDHKGKSLTKQEVMDYIRKNQIEIEEVNYAENIDIENETREYIKYMFAGGKSIDELQQEVEENAESADRYDRLGDNPDQEDLDEYLMECMVNEYGDDFTRGYTISDGNIEYDTQALIDTSDIDAYNREVAGNDNKAINETRKEYTTDFLNNKREIALTIPNIEEWNEEDDIHFGDAGDGRAVAWVRFGETTDADGKRVLVIDEIQSKRHQEGREKGYKHEIPVEGVHVGEYVPVKNDKYADRISFANVLEHDDIPIGQIEKIDGKYRPIDSAGQNIGFTDYDTEEKAVNAVKKAYATVEGIPDAPFEKNWHEVAMKRMLRYAAENGYDKVAWTTGEQQADRYDLSKEIESIDVSDWGETPSGITTRVVTINAEDNNRWYLPINKEGVIVGNNDFVGKRVEDVFGKSLSERIMADGIQVIEGDGLRVGGEGMKGFYDQILPRFMDKYGKKWNVKTTDITLPNIGDNGLVMHSIDVTPEMKASVMEGQPMFFRTEDGEVWGYALNGKIYIDPSVATAETPIHEYTHLWTEALRKANPAAWERLKEEMRQQEGLMDYVRSMYPELTNEDELLDEVFAHYSGQRGSERLESDMREAIAQERDLTLKAQVALVFHKLREVLQKFWSMARDLFAGKVEGIENMTAEDFADMALGDLLRGFDPRGAARERTATEQSAKEARDKEYMEAVEKGDVEAEQKMVAEAAKAAMPDTKVVDENSMPLVVVHHTNGDFTKFDINRLGENSGDKGLYGAGFYFSTKGTGGIYGNREMEVYLNIRKPFEIDDYINEDTDQYTYFVEHFNIPELRELVMTENGKTITVGEYIDNIKSVDEEIAKSGVTAESLADDEELQYYRPQDRMSMYREHRITDLCGFPLILKRAYIIAENIGSEEFTDALKRAGYDGVVVNKGDGVFEYVAFDPNQIKSADPVTYDDNGDVIPLSKRFDKLNADIRYQKAENTDGKTIQKNLQSEEFKTGIDTGSKFGDVAKVLQKIVTAKNNSQDTENGALMREGDQQETDGSSVSDVKEIRFYPERDGYVEGIGMDITMHDDHSYHAFVELDEDENVGLKVGDISDWSSNDEEEGDLDWEGENIVDLLGSKIASQIMRAERGTIHPTPTTGARTYDEALASARRAGYSKRQFDAMVKRQERRARQRVADFVEKLNLSDRVTVVDTIDEVEGLTDRQREERSDKKGWYDRRNGRIVVILDNHHSVDDILKTVLHEGVAHHGLRALFGSHFDTFLDNVYVAADEVVRKRINDLARNHHNWDLRTATEEYLAGLAEETDFENADRQTWWFKIKDLFYDMLGKLGITGQRFYASISDNELRYLLWRSYQNLTEPGRFRTFLGEAEDVVMQNKLKVGDYETIDFAHPRQGTERRRPADAEDTARDNAYWNWIESLESGMYTIDEAREILKAAYLELPNATGDRQEQIRGAIEALRPWIEFMEQEEAPEERDSWWSNAAERQSEVLMLGHEGDTFRAVGKAAKTVSDILGIPQASDGSVSFPISDIHENLSKLVRSGLRVGIAERLPEGAAEDDVVFREGDGTPRIAARDTYERMMQSGVNQFTEAVQDSGLSLKKLYEAILGQKGEKFRIEDVKGYENAYLAENRMASSSEAQVHAWQKDYYEPIVKAAHRLMGGRYRQEVYDDLTDYMMAKHGLERNEVMARRDAERAAVKDMPPKPDKPKDESDTAAMDAYNQQMQDWNDQMQALADGYYYENRQRDYAGLTALTGEDDVANAEAAAQKMVDDYENTHEADDIDTFWDAVNRATKSSLRKIAESGMLSPERFAEIRDMYQYYIPLQGFDTKVAEEVYAYMGSDGTLGYGTPIKTAKGRKSKADDPLATISMNGEAAIRKGNRNLMKQHFLRFAESHPSDLVSVNDVWLRKSDVTGEWEQYFDADIQESDSPAEVAKKVADFEEKMEALAKDDPEHYKRGADLPNVPFRVLQTKDMNQHQAVVQRGGKTYVLTINGNPRAAQALNGLTNPDVFTEGAFGKVMNAGQWFNRQLSAFYTTRNPEFVLSNFLRDAVYTNSMTWVKESPSYAIKFHKNFGLMNPIHMGRLFATWESGSLREKILNGEANETERLFYDFMMNGGETGWTSLRDIEKQKRDLEKALKREGNISKKAWKALGGAFDLMNRSVENCARFAAFVTSREMGRSLERSIWDAKEVSVNFNKKGAGDKFINAKGQKALGVLGAIAGGLGRRLYVFFNASLQGLHNIGKATKRHPWKAAGGLFGTLFTLGAVMPLLSALIGGDDGDDDDKDSYYNLPEYVRRSNLCFRWSKDMPWITIPLPIEYRAIYGLGELATGMLTGKERYSDEEAAKQFVSQLSQVLPLDFMEGGGGWHAFVPSQVKPLLEAQQNVSWTGLPIYRKEKNNPQWTRAYESANKQIVEATRWLNEATGGDAVTQGWIDWNPAKIEYMLKGYLGGYFSMYDRMQKTAETVLGKRDFEWRNIPMASRVLKEGDERTEARKTTNDYFNLLNEYQKTDARLRGYRKKEKDGTMGPIERAHYIDLLNNDVDYTKYLIMDAYSPILKEYYNLSQKADTEAEKRRLQSTEAALRKQCVDIIHAIEEGKDIDVEAELNASIIGIIQDEEESAVIRKKAQSALKKHRKKVAGQ